MTISVPTPVSAVRNAIYVSLFGWYKSEQTQLLDVPLTPQSISQLLKQAAQDKDITSRCKEWLIQSSEFIANSSPEVVWGFVHSAALQCHVKDNSSVSKANLTFVEQSFPGQFPAFKNVLVPLE